ncbi:MAG: chemotaxis protein CheX [Candidatus Nitrohelix vancouverensis]|uniref:Chemotaxis protein CheX n=1 Tax=Candidatus Nitrohelix vancouverensis TaxID=2705534 RepID=A0A7T0C3A8_9BACT|nr:MAG: chemotaxis protein CheX [Candidatus Nitrohelix vancouverensis]
MVDLQMKDGVIPSELSECVKGSVISIFNTIMGNDPTYHEVTETKKLGDGVVGIISFVGDMNWLLMLTLPKDSAEKYALKFVGFDISYDSEDMGGVVAELANCLAGDIVARLGKINVKASMSLPTVMRGQNVEPILPRGTPTCQQLFSLPEGEMLLKLAGAKPGETLGRIPGT